jgi:hypothetical protein
VDRFSNEQILGYLSFHSTTNDHSLRFQEIYAREVVSQAFEHLRAAVDVLGVNALVDRTASAPSASAVVAGSRSAQHRSILG